MSTPSSRTELPPAATARHRAPGPRPAFSMGALWCAGFTAAGFALLLVLAVTLLFRSFFNLPVYQSVGGKGDGGIGPLALGVIIAMLIATLLISVLLRATDRPGQLFGAAIGLGWIAFVIVLFATSSRNPSQRFGEFFTSLIFAVIFLWFGRWIARCAVGWARH